MPVEAQQAPIARTHTPEEDHFQTERVVAILLVLALAWYLRGRDPGYSTAYMDESIYVIYGRMFLKRHFEAPLDTPLQWSFGWYLWPALVAIADRIGGLIGLRELAAALSTLTVAAVYGFTSRIFSKVIGLAAALIFAVLGPAILVARIATRDSGSITFFAFGLWAYAAAFQDNKKKQWLLAGLAFFAAFLCKYLVAIFFPFLVLIALKKGKNAVLMFAAPLFSLSLIYGMAFRADLLHLLRYGTGYASLKAPGAQAWKIYVSGRIDFWLIAALAAMLLFLRKEWRWRAAALWLGVATLYTFQLKTRADYDYWKHVNYALLFLVPMAAAGLLALLEKIKSDHGTAIWTGICGALLASGAVAWAGGLGDVESFVFWPNVDPITAYFDGRLSPNDRLLVDDTVMRYYFERTLSQTQIVDPMYVEYRGQTGDAGYTAAVKEGAYDYIILDGGIGEEARRMQAAIRPELGAYRLQLAMRDPVMGQKIEIYRKADIEPVATNSPVRMTSLASNSVVSTENGEVKVEGTTSGAPPGANVELEVFTNRWYRQGPEIMVAKDGSFNGKVILGGARFQQCQHMLRARLFDFYGHELGHDLIWGVARANADGSAPKCE